MGHAMTNFPDPKNVGELKWACGMLNFYRRFVSNYSAFSALPHAGVKLGRKFKESSAEIRQSLVENAVLHHSDILKLFIISRDVDTTGISHTTCQLVE